MRREFRKTVLAYYEAHGRDLPWRHTRDPYRVLVSEVMLQQTQVVRVAERYEAFLDDFPDVEALARAPLEKVLRAWRGLGYNRRALALKRLAEQVTAEMGAQLPRDPALLRRLPGVGPATAVAVAAFCFDDPHPYLETNIRTAYLHHFFPDREGVTDAELMPLVEMTLDRQDPRTWYYALMDYGSMLKRTLPNPSRRSRHHTRQSQFEGSKRQLRARVLGVLLDRPDLDRPDLDPNEVVAALAREEHAGGPQRVAADEATVEAILRELADEGFLVAREGRFRPAD
ncbi:MAG: A/G-specific adenine glycosylase [Actinobacteria bacterium]|nr:A/G-specific adenine glycosylase [Actinomycetota bacterium]